MLVSAEIRWFWKAAAPPALESWFRGGPFPPGGGVPRADEYLVDPGQRQLGVKSRGGAAGVEEKGLIDVRGVLPAPFAGRIQLWSKWRSAMTIDRQPRVQLHKTRWIRKFDSSGAVVTEVELDAAEQPRREGERIARGCQFELVAVRVGERPDTWWTLGFEAFGERDTLEDSLRRTVLHLKPTVPSLPEGDELSYPEWLDTLDL